MAKSDQAVALLDRTREVEIETVSPKGAKHRVPIWVVVVDGTPYVASVRAARGRWWRELVVAKEGALIARGRRFSVKPHRVTSDATKRDVSAAYGRKYRTSKSSVQAMQRPAVLDTTLRLELA